jgi:threonine synthase
MQRYRALVAALRRAVLEQPGATAPALRLAASENRGVAAALAGYVDKVANHAYKVTDEEVAALITAGHGEDELFEITASAALGAALRRLEAGLAPLGEGE